MATWTTSGSGRRAQCCEAHDLHLGIHTLSAVNVAEFSPYMSEAVDAYIQANIDLGKQLVRRPRDYPCWAAPELGAGPAPAGIAGALSRAADYAAAAGVTLLLENLNFEPPRS